jgi:hypothetical protein
MQKGQLLQCLYHLENSGIFRQDNGHSLGRRNWIAKLSVYAGAYQGWAPVLHNS